MKHALLITVLFFLSTYAHAGEIAYSYSPSVYIMGQTYTDSIDVVHDYTYLTLNPGVAYSITFKSSPEEEEFVGMFYLDLTSVDTTDKTGKITHSEYNSISVGIHSAEETLLSAINASFIVGMGMGISSFEIEEPLSAFHADLSFETKIALSKQLNVGVGMRHQIIGNSGDTVVANASFVTTHVGIKF